MLTMTTHTEHARCAGKTRALIAATIEKAKREPGVTHYARFSKQRFEEVARLEGYDMDFTPNAYGWDVVGWASDGDGTAEWEVVLV